MYVKKLLIKNYRKYGHDKQEIDFSHSKWPNLEELNEEEKEEATENYISQSSTLIVGKNNSGKSTIIKLLKTLQNTRSGSKKVFKYTDFNLKMLSDWYKDNVDGKSEENIKSIDIPSFPSLEFRLILGIDNESDRISSFEDILVLGGIELEEVREDIDEVAEVTININYEVNDTKSFLGELVKIKTKYTLGEEIGESKREYQKELQYREFLSLFSSDYFALNFYPLGSDEPAKEFSLSPLLKVETIEANNVKNDKTLSRAYNKIVSSYIKNHDITDIDDLVSDVNYNVKELIDGDIKGILQKAVSSIESPKNLKMNLHPDVTLEKIFANNIIFEYQEGNHNIPENQFGMGYTNLMVIIAEIVDYIELYNENDINGSVNILCIEEPESFMHPQMQELFIKNISKAISILLGKKGLLSTFQVVITTHSPHILNSKIHSGNTLNNISYLGQSGEHNIIRNINDNAILSDNDSDIRIYEYIKKYLRLEVSDIFFADAVILVEGVSEETYLRYEIDKHPILKNNYIKVYRIDGAYAHQFITLLSLLGIKTIIFTDLDLKRQKDEKEIDIKDNDEPDIIPPNISDLEEKYEDFEEFISTNSTLKFFMKKVTGNDKLNAKCFNNKLITMINNKEELIVGNDKDNNITLYSQGKINGYYATSFEEAIVLTNGIRNDNRNKKSLIKLLQYVHPQMKYFRDLDKDSDIVSKSYMYQVKLSDGKSKFSTGLVFLSTTDEAFRIKMPQYIQSGLDVLSDYFEE